MTSHNAVKARNTRNGETLPPIRTFLATELALPLPHLPRYDLDNVHMDPIPLGLRETAHEFARPARPDPQDAPASAPASTSVRSSSPSSRARGTCSQPMSVLPSNPPPPYVYSVLRLSPATASPAFAYNVLRPSPFGDGLITSAPMRSRPRSSSMHQPASPQPSTSASTNSTTRVHSDGARRHVCTVCQKRFKRPSSLKTHRNVHTGSRPFPCPHPGCTKVFSVASNMRRHHLRTHRGDTDTEGEPDAEEPDHEGFYEWTIAYKGP